MGKADHFVLHFDSCKITQTVRQFLIKWQTHAQLGISIRFMGKYFETILSATKIP